MTEQQQRAFELSPAMELIAVCTNKHLIVRVAGHKGRLWWLSPGGYLTRCV